MNSKQLLDEENRSTPGFEVSQPTKERPSEERSVVDIDTQKREWTWHDRVLVYLGYCRDPSCYSFLFFRGTSAFACMYVSVLHVCLVSEEARSGQRIP